MILRAGWLLSLRYFIQMDLSIAPASLAQLAPSPLLPQSHPLDSMT